MSNQDFNSGLPPIASSTRPAAKRSSIATCSCNESGYESPHSPPLLSRLRPCPSFRLLEWLQDPTEPVNRSAILLPGLVKVKIAPHH
ncbi:hypothetical protein KP509_18G069000 [Ceratopteris richardii]|uniref:Uncharacterized protein n=1 Tax=Ceratopteris richardii TaxID=49495 RepID=A0A8T2STY6_CERRI|nr:hypothetical protein KP509_18G069000 [Ceratopteris richardii]